MPQSEKKHANLPLLLGILFVVLLAGGGWYAYTTFFQQTQTGEDIFANKEGGMEFPLKKVDWNKAIFTSPAFRSLTKDFPATIPVSPAEIGNESPFLTERQ
ncbi:hypothetical protein HY622_03365 [Candidatus Uhrbacteria bacterium]|nr:hypothetical protein [Candidatus Uhrbacteria bacterium]